MYKPDNLLIYRHAPSVLHGPTTYEINAVTSEYRNDFIHCVDRLQSFGRANHTVRKVTAVL